MSTSDEESDDKSSQEVVEVIEENSENRLDVVLSTGDDSCLSDLPSDDNISDSTCEAKPRGGQFPIEEGASSFIGLPSGGYTCELCFTVNARPYHCLSSSSRLRYFKYFGYLSRLIRANYDRKRILPYHILFGIVRCFDNDRKGFKIVLKRPLNILKSLLTYSGFKHYRRHEKLLSNTIRDKYLYLSNNVSEEGISFYDFHEQKYSLIKYNSKIHWIEVLDENAVVTQVRCVHYLLSRFLLPGCFRVDDRELRHIGALI
jgi:hypothetical protein